MLGVRLAAPQVSIRKTIVFHVSQGGTSMLINALKSVLVKMDISISLLQRESAQYQELSVPSVMS